jgi:hypothetical protein
MIIINTKSFLKLFGQLLRFIAAPVTLENINCPAPKTQRAK